MSSSPPSKSMLAGETERARVEVAGNQMPASVDRNAHQGARAAQVPPLTLTAELVSQPSTTSLPWLIVVGPV